MPEKKVKSILAQEVDPRKAFITIDLELIDSVAAIDQERRSGLSCMELLWLLYVHGHHGRHSFCLVLCVVEHCCCVCVQAQCFCSHHGQQSTYTGG